MIQDEFPKDAIFDDKDIDDQEWFVLLQHDVAKVGPEMNKSQILQSILIIQMDLNGHLSMLTKEVSFTVFYRSTDGNADLPMPMCKRLIGCVPYLRQGYR
ncbi:MAG: hypothetical protein ACLTZB_07960 [Streptococcus salivarius]